MTLLRMDTGEVEGVAANIRYSLDNIEENIHQIQSSANQLAWEAPTAVDLRSDIQACCSHLLNLIEDGRGMVTRVSTEVSQWEENGARFFGQPINLPFLTIAGGGIPVSLAAALSLAGQTLAPYFSLATTLLNKLPPWLQNIFSTHVPETPKTTDPIPPAWKETTSTAEDQGKKDVNSVVSTDSIPPDHPNESTPSAEQQRQNVTEQHDVPIKSQIGLVYGKNKTAYGCVPTSASMITDYWHQENEANQTISAQDLLTQNATEETGSGKHQFTATGMTINNLKDDLEPMGYQVDTVMGKAENGDAQLQALHTAVEKGPVIAVVHLGMGSTGVPHAVVVTGYTQDGKVMVNDPYTASKQVFSVEEFDRSWGSSFGNAPDGTPFATRSYTTILPTQN